MYFYHLIHFISIAKSSKQKFFNKNSEKIMISKENVPKDMSEENNDLLNEFGHHKIIPNQTIVEYLYSAFYRGLIEIGDTNGDNIHTYDDLIAHCNDAITKKNFKESYKNTAIKSNGFLSGLKDYMSNSKEEAPFFERLELVAYFENVKTSIDAFLKFENTKFKKLDQYITNNLDRYRFARNFFKLLSYGVVFIGVYIFVEINCKPY